MNKVKSCMIGESVFKVGDYTSLTQGWNTYKDQLSLEECTVLKIKDIYYIKEENSSLPKFRALVETNKGRIVDIAVSDMSDVRNSRENREELNKVGYDFAKGCIYSKGFENSQGTWEFFDVGVNNNSICF